VGVRRLVAHRALAVVRLREREGQGRLLRLVASPALRRRPAVRRLGPGEWRTVRQRREAFRRL